MALLAGMPLSAFTGQRQGLLSTNDREKQLRQRGLLGLASGLLAASGPSTTPISTGQALGQGLLSLQEAQGGLGAGVADPSAVREFQFFQGLNPEEQEQFLTVKRSQPFLDVGAGFVAPSRVDPTQVSPVAEKELPPAQRPETKGAQITAEEEARTSAKKRRALPKARGSIRAFKLKADIVRNKVDEALELIGPTTAGAGAALSLLPATKARKLRGILNTIEANLAFGELREIKETGGTLGSVSAPELILLKAGKQDIDQAQEDADLAGALLNVKDIMDRMERNSFIAFEEDFGQPFEAQQQPDIQPSVPPLPEGFSIR